MSLLKTLSYIGYCQAKNLAKLVDEFHDRMTAQGIGVGVHYLSISEHPYYQETFGWQPEVYPNAMRIGRQTVSLPLSAKLTDEDVEDVIKAVVNIIELNVK